MKTFVKTSALFLMLCCALQLSTSTESTDSANSICCFNTSNSKIPLTRLKSYFWTSSRCPLKHIVFVTVKKQICMDPENKWVQLGINHIDKKRGSNSRN